MNEIACHVIGAEEANGPSDDEDEYYVAKEGKDLDGVCSVIDDESDDFEEPDGTVAISLGKPDDASVNIDEIYDSVNGVSMAFGANGVATGTAHHTLQCTAASDPEIIPMTSLGEASVEIRPEKNSNPKQPINADHPTETPRGQHTAATKS